MELETVIHKYKRTNIFVVDEELWAWAAYRAKTLKFDNASAYLFDLIRLDKEKNLVGERKE
jgi:hypothetical protein